MAQVAEKYHDIIKHCDTHKTLTFQKAIVGGFISPCIRDLPLLWGLVARVTQG